jgi:hypothetical protein
MNFALFKEHPYATAGGAVVLFVILYLAMNSSSSAASSPSSLSTGSDYSAADLQMAQIQAGAQAQANQIQGAMNIAQIQANVANGQTAAQVQENSDSLAASLAAIQAQTQAAIETTANNNATQVSLANITTSAATTQTQIQAQENEMQTQALANIEMNQTNQATQQHADTLNYLYGVTQLQTGLQSQALDDQTQIAQTQIDDQSRTAQDAISLIQSGALNKGGAGGTYQTQALETVLGNPGGAVQSTGAVGVSAQQSSAAAFTALTNLGGSIAAALFA